MLTTWPQAKFDQLQFMACSVHRLTGSSRATLTTLARIDSTMADRGKRIYQDILRQNEEFSKELEAIKAKIESLRLSRLAFDAASSSTASSQPTDGARSSFKSSFVESSPVSHHETTRSQTRRKTDEGRVPLGNSSDDEHNSSADDVSTVTSRLEQALRQLLTNPTRPHSSMRTPKTSRQFRRTQSFKPAVRFPHRSRQTGDEGDDGSSDRKQSKILPASRERGRPASVKVHQDDDAAATPPRHYKSTEWGSRPSARRPLAILGKYLDEKGYEVVTPSLPTLILARTRAAVDSVDETYLWADEDDDCAAKCWRRALAGDTTPKWDLRDKKAAACQQCISQRELCFRYEGRGGGIRGLHIVTALPRSLRPGKLPEDEEFWIRAKD